MLKDVRKYCAKVAAPKDSSETIAFDRRGFLTMHPSLREFCAQLFQTQLFQRFVERSAQYVCVLARLYHMAVWWQAIV